MIQALLCDPGQCEGWDAIHGCRAAFRQGELGVWKELLWSAESSLLLNEREPRLNLCRCFWLLN